MLLHTSILCPLEIQVCDRSRSIYTLVIIFFANENIFGLIPLMCVCLFFATNYNSNAKIDDSVVPILLPAVTPTSESAMAGLLSRLDGILLTGSPSNVHPRHYHGTKATGPFDERRDEMTLPLLRATLASRVPLLAICRGLQELNVAYGGTLHHAVHELPDRIGLPSLATFAFFACGLNAISRSIAFRLFLILEVDMQCVVLITLRLSRPTLRKSSTPVHMHVTSPYCW